MGTVLALAKALTLLLIASAFGYYLYTGLKAYRIELGDFEPTPYDSSEASRSALSGIREQTAPVSWQLANGAVQSAYFRSGTSGAVAIALHGSPGSGAGFYPLVAALAEYGVGTLVIDLPGYGSSEGDRTWAGHYEESVLLGLDFLDSQPDVDPDRITVLGYSQGGNIAARMAARDERISRVICMACYTNLHDQLLEQFRWRLPGIGLFAIAAAKASGVKMDLMDSIAALSQVSHKPLLVISGDNDHAIPVAMAETLAATSSHGQLWIIEGGNHINLSEVAGDALYERIAKFVAEKSVGIQKDSDEH